MWNLERLVNSNFGTKIRHTQFLLAIFIFSTLALMPNPDKVGFTQSDVTLHFIGNILLILSAWVACLGRFHPLLPLLFAIPYSITIELSQSLISTRQPELMDAFANISGLIVGFLICLVLEHFYNRAVKASY